MRLWSILVNIEDYVGYYLPTISTSQALLKSKSAERNPHLKSNKPMKFSIDRLINHLPVPSVFLDYKSNDSVVNQASVRNNKSYKSVINTIGSNDQSIDDINSSILSQRELMFLEQISRKRVNMKKKQKASNIILY